MTNDTAGNRVKLSEEAKVNAACRVQIDHYLCRTGLRLEDFGRRIGYAHSTMKFFMADSYENVGGSARNLVKAAMDFMDQHPIGESMRILGDLYETENVRLIQQIFEKLLPQPAIYVVHAPPGSQKSFVLEHQVAKLNQAEVTKPQGRRAFYVYARQNLRPRDLMCRIAVACGCPVSAQTDRVIAGIRFEFRNNRVLLVIDEAQHLSIQCLETVRELFDRPPYFSILLSGSHDLKRMFDQFSATLEQWNSRIIEKVRLPGLKRVEARGIIDREVGGLLAERAPRERELLADKLIARATVRDAFENNRTYINVRTLVNALLQIKTNAADRDPDAGQEEQ